MRILIAEDQKDLNKILMKKLTAEGYSVDTAFDGEEALDFIRMADYDGMILDINMPRKNGLEVVETIRKHATPSRTKLPDWILVPMTISLSLSLSRN